MIHDARASPPRSADSCSKAMCRSKAWNGCSQAVTGPSQAWRSRRSTGSPGVKTASGAVQPYQVVAFGRSGERAVLADFPARG